MRPVPPTTTMCMVASCLGRRCSPARPGEARRCDTDRHARAGSARSGVTAEQGRVAGKDETHRVSPGRAPNATPEAESDWTRSSPSPVTPSTHCPVGPGRSRTARATVSFPIQRGVSHEGRRHRRNRTDRLQAGREAQRPRPRRESCRPHDRLQHTDQRGRRRGGEGRRGPGRRVELAVVRGRRRHELLRRRRRRTWSPPRRQPGSSTTWRCPSSGTTGSQTADTCAPRSLRRSSSRSPASRTPIVRATQFFEFLPAIADTPPSMGQVHLPSRTSSRWPLTTSRPPSVGPLRSAGQRRRRDRWSREGPHGRVRRRRTQTGQ